MYHIKVQQNGHWVEIYATPDVQDALDVYDESPEPRMLLGHSPTKSGILHKQYTSDPHFTYRPKWAEQENRT